MQFKGREIQFKDLGHNVLMKIFTPLQDIAVMEGAPKMEGKAMTMQLSPKKK